MDDPRPEVGDCGVGSGERAASESGRLLSSKVIRERCCWSSFTILHSSLGEKLLALASRIARRGCSMAAAGGSKTRPYGSLAGHLQRGHGMPCRYYCSADRLSFDPLAPLLVPLLFRARARICPV